MAEYIERERLKQAIAADALIALSDWDSSLMDLIMLELEEIPAVDVAPVVHGKWITRSDKGVISMTHPYMCSRCWRVEMNKEPYCNCGAKMDGGADNATD